MSVSMVDSPIRPASAMPEEPDQAIRFGKARTAQSGALLEDYVELISDLHASNGEARPTDIARRLGVSHATVIKTIGRLKREGLAVAKPYRGVFLTEQGESLADRVRSRHRVVVDLLLAVGVPFEAAESDAEGIEHHVSDTTLAAFARFLARGGGGWGSLLAKTTISYHGQHDASADRRCKGIMHRHVTWCARSRNGQRPRYHSTRMVSSAFGTCRPLTSLKIP